MKITTVDAFTNKPFAGNPAGVCVLEKPLDEKTMQSIANEMNLAETAFLYPIQDGYHLRWFTPEIEAKLCGHATLATSHVLWEEGILPANEQAVFHTLSGKLTARKSGDWIELDFPAIFSEKIAIPTFLEEGLKVEILNVNYCSQGYYIAEVESEDVVRNISPDFNKLKEQGGLIIVSAKSKNDKYDFVSRVFAPSYGINEDPVTGAAHCCLTPYWSERLNKKQFHAFQASKRGGELKLELNENRVKLIGQAVTVLRGEIL